MRALIVIDVQQEYSSAGALPVARFAETVENVSALLDAARSSSTTLIAHVRHVSRAPGDSSFDAGSPTLEFVDQAKPLPGEFVLTKHYPGAFSNPDLDRHLLRNQVDEVVICGLTSILCCDSTAREAHRLGYKVYYVDDAISEFPLGEIGADELHRVVNAIQGAMFSTVMTTEDVLPLIKS